MKKEVNDLIYKNEAYNIIGACFTVYKDKGCGFLEAVYQECLGSRLVFGITLACVRVFGGLPS